MNEQDNEQEILEKNNPIPITNFRVLRDNSSIQLDKIFTDDYKYYLIKLKAEFKNKKDEDGYICMDFKIGEKDYLCHNSLSIEYLNPKLEITENNIIISKTYNNLICYIHISNPNTTFDKSIIFNSNENKVYGSYSINSSLQFDGVRFFIWKPNYIEHNKFTKIFVNVYGYKDIMDIDFF